MPKEVEDMLKEKGKANQPSEDDTKDLSDVPPHLRKYVEEKQQKSKSKKSKDEDEDEKCPECGKANCECDEAQDHKDMIRKGPKKSNKSASVHFTHPSQLSAEAVEAALASGDKALANTILAARHERRVRLASQIQTRIASENEKNVKLAQRRAYREQLVKIAEKAEEKDAMNKMCEKCGGKYAGEGCEACSAGKKESGYGKSETEMKKASSLSNNAKKAFAAKALAEGFPVEYVEAMLGNTGGKDNLKEIKNVMASELASNVKIAAVSSMVKTATLTDADYSRLVDYWKNELGYGDQEWIDALFTKKYDK
jgi:hypothetical protein